MQQDLFNPLQQVRRLFQHSELFRNVFDGFNSREITTFYRILF